MEIESQLRVLTFFLIYTTFFLPLKIYIFLYFTIICQIIKVPVYTFDFFIFRNVGYYAFIVLVLSVFPKYALYKCYDFCASQNGKT